MKLFDLSGKIAVITGSSRGIARATAKAMAFHDARVPEVQFARLGCAHSA